MLNSRIWVYSGNRPSNGAKDLAEQDGFLRLRDGRQHKIKPEDILVNWGSTMGFNIKPGGYPAKWLNGTDGVASATNKLDAFKAFALAGVSTVEFTTDKKVVQSWLDDERTVVARKKLTGHSGEGIVIIDKDNPELVDAPLYTRYIFKDKEFRCHVVNGKVVDTQRKIKDPERDVLSWKVRSHENGFIYVRGGITTSGVRDDLAVAAVGTLGLDFGAVDIIEDKKGAFYVLEVNTAPGLEGQTVTSYAAAFRGYHGN